ncbi:MAG TPA: hypothetical protein VNS46_13675 [Nocardioides sp.]|nr:hypothetical protein [Nocardioides sp.]
MNNTPDPSAQAPARGGRRSTVALGVAVVALLASTTGTAYAAVVARNSVVSSSIKDGQVKALDLAAGSVTGSRVRDGALTGADVADGRLGSADIRDGAVSSADIAYIGTESSISAPIQDADGTTNGGQHGIVEVTTNCQAGARIIGGGAEWTGASNPDNYDRNVYLQSSHQVGNGWRARGIVDFGAAGSIKLKVSAYCLTDGSYTKALRTAAE